MGAVREIEILVFEKYPKTLAERRCLTEKRMMDRLREHYRQKLINEFTAKAKVLDSVCEAAKAD
jgi:hypothetical protein